MRLKFIWVGKTRDPYLAGLEERYLKRLCQFFPAETTSVRDLKKTSPRQHVARTRQEADSIERKLSAPGYRVILDEGGKEHSSRELASLLQKLMNQGISQLTFVVGGCSGIPEQIRESGHLRLSLSRLTLPHEMARVLLLEQVYRALTILKGWPYHKSRRLDHASQGTGKV